MASLALTINTKPRQQKVLVEMDADKFENLAASFGFFSQNFIKSLNKAEKDYRSGRVKKISSLKSLSE